MNHCGVCLERPISFSLDHLTPPYFRSVTMNINHPILIVLLILLHVESGNAFGPKKFQQWFPHWQSAYEIGGVCAGEIGTYWADNSTIPWRCQAAIDCIIGNLSGSALQEMSSSLFVLGLTPAILSQLGLRLSESSMLSYRRPGLSFLLSMGSPAVFLSRIFQYDAPLSALKRVVRDQPASPRGKRFPGREFLISAAEYVLAIGAIANVVEMGIALGWRSVLTWDCNSTWLPFAWVLFPGLIHILGAISFRRIPKSERASEDSGQRMHWSIQELLPCHAQEKLRVEVDLPDTTTMMLNNVAQFLAVFHVVVGILIFSGCQFLRMTDAVPLIWRFCVSALMCRFIYIYELRGMSCTLDIDYRSSDGGRASSEVCRIHQNRSVPSADPSAVIGTTLPAGAIRHYI
jgi:hypothetical protein